MTITVSRWVDLPSSVNPVLATDEPLGAGTLQVAASTANFGARINNLRMLWEHPGPGSEEIRGDVAWDNRPDSFPWDTDPVGATRVFTAFAGVHRLRPYGQTGSLPKITLSCRMATSANSIGVILVARATVGRPSANDLFGTVTTTSGTLVTKTITLSPTPTSLGVRPIAPALGTAYPIPPPVESGQDTVVALYVGAWRTGAAGTAKGTVAGISIYLEAP